MVRSQLGMKLEDDTEVDEEDWRGPYSSDDNGEVDEADRKHWEV